MLRDVIQRDLGRFEGHISDLGHENLLCWPGLFFLCIVRIKSKHAHAYNDITIVKKISLPPFWHSTRDDEEGVGYDYSTAAVFRGPVALKGWGKGGNHATVWMKRKVYFWLFLVSKYICPTYKIMYNKSVPSN